SHAASQSLEVLPHASHPRQVVFELGEFHLELALGRHRVLGEDVQDQLSPVDDARLERVLESPLLRRVELVVHEQDLRAGTAEGMLELLELSLAHVRAPVRASALLDQLRNGLDACCAGELAQLGELVGFVASRPQHRDGEPALGLGTGRRIRLAVCHETDYGLDGPPQASVLPCASPPSWPPTPRTPSFASSSP